jgi:hypothetical protein
VRPAGLSSPACASGNFFFHNTQSRSSLLLASGLALETNSTKLSTKFLNETAHRHNRDPRGGTAANLGVQLAGSASCSQDSIPPYLFLNLFRPVGHSWISYNELCQNANVWGPRFFGELANCSEIIDGHSDAISTRFSGAQHSASRFSE